MLLSELAKVVRTKNAGPFELTIDVLFDDRTRYELVQTSGVLNRATIARLYKVAEDDVITCEFFDGIMGFKATIPRPHAQGSIGETDIHACQQHAPVAELEIPAPTMG